jgi:hypothetical protein
MGELRVNIEGLGYAGLVEVSASTTLAQLRSTLALTFDVESLPAHYQFLLGSGQQASTVGSRKEASTLAWSLRPALTLLPISESPIAGEEGGRWGDGC